MRSLSILLDRPLRPHHLPFLMGQAEDVFASRDLQIQLHPPDQNPTGLERLYQGEAEYALASPLQLVADSLRGHEPVGIARFFHSESGFLYRADRGLQQPVDLTSDHTVAVRGHDLGLAESLLAVLGDREESSDATKPEFVSASPSPSADLLDERADVLMTASLNLEGIPLNQSDQDVDFWFFDEEGFPANNDLVLVTTRRHADEQPRINQELVHGLHEAITGVLDDLDRARDLFRQEVPELDEFPGGRALLLSAPSELTPNFSQDFENYIAWGDFLQEHAGLEGFLDVDRLLDERFLPMEAMNL